MEGQLSIKSRELCFDKWIVSNNEEYPYVQLYKIVESIEPFAGYDGHTQDKCEI